jgi:transglutaminase-like putative cysteine protease
MRIRIRHEVRHRLEPNLRTATATIRVTPRNHVGQHILRWSLDIVPDCRIYPQEDAFGNLTHTFSLDGPGEHITLLAEGEVETQDTSGIVRGTVERFPPSFFRRQTHLTEPSDDLNALAAEVAKAAEDDLGRMHALMALISERFEEIEGEGAVPAAADVAEKLVGTSAGLSQVFTSVARIVGVPARQVSGYAVEEDTAGAARQWAEAYVPKIGWVGFDAGRCLCTTDAHVRLAVGLDTLAVAPIRALGVTDGVQVLAKDTTLPSRGGQSQSQSQG